MVAYYVKRFTDFIHDLGRLLMDRSQSMKCLDQLAFITKDGMWISAVPNHDNGNRSIVTLLSKIFEIEEQLEESGIIPSIANKAPLVLNKYKSHQNDAKQITERKLWHLKNPQAIVAMKGIKAHLIEIQNVDIE